MLLTAPAFPQSSNGSVRGTVTDQTKAVIPEVNVSITNMATGVGMKTVSNSVGFFAFPAVVPGVYKVVAEFAGMSKFEVTVEVQTQQSSTLEVILQPAGTQTVVNVQDATPVLTTDTSTLSHTLERTRIEQLPINGRSVMNLLATVPGINADDGVRVFGTRAGTHDVVLDGAALTDQLYGGGSVTRMPSLDSIAEFHVEINSTSAKFSRQATVILTTKGGTNELHGSLFETNRNNGYGVARARDNFTNTAAKLNRNEFGGTVGGPLYIPKVYDGRNKTFWFFNYEGFKQRSGSYGNYRVPTQAMRNGDFSGLVDSAGTLQTVYDPLTTGTGPNYLRQPFNYGGKLNAIDPARISPFMKYVYSVLPLPNVGNNVNPLVGNNYSGAAPNMQNQYTWGARFDHRFSDADLVYARITKGMASTNRPANGGVPTLGGFGNSRYDTAPNESLSLDWTHTFSPTFFNEFMFSASRTESTNFSGDPTRYYSTELGLPNPGNQPGFPVVNNIGVGTGRNNYFAPVNWNMQYFNYFIMENNGTKIHGKHEFQYGMHLRYDQLTYMPQQQRTAGAVTFQANTTGLYDPVNSNASTRRMMSNTGHVAAASYLGYANYEVRASKGKYYMHQNEDSLYFQDNWRATNRLTVNLGLRWQFSPYPNDKYFIMSGYDKKNNAIVLGNTLDTFYKIGATNPALIKVLTGYGMKFETWKDAGLPQKLVNDNWKDIGPHVGFAYRAFDGPKSFVIRGGYALNYNLIPIYGWNDRMRMNTPFAGFYQNYELSNAAQSPDGIGNWGLVNAPSIVAGKNSANAVTFAKPMGINPGSESFQNAYFNPDQPTSRVHDWNLTLEKEIMRDTVMRVGYVGNHATHQDSYDDWNQPMPEYTWVATTKTQYPWDDESKPRPMSPMPYGNLQEYRKDGWGWSNGTQIEFERRYSKGFGFQVFYMMMNTNKAAGHGWYDDSLVSPVSSFLPGSIPTDHYDRLRLLSYKRDTTVPQHEVRWNFIVDLPFGKGKPILGRANSFLNAIIGGWQVSSMGRWKTNWFSLPTGDTWPTGEKVEYYGHKYPIEDCRDGSCRPGYLMWNGYIPAHQINSYGADGKPNGVMGVPANYKPATSPLFPYPADYNKRSAATDPNYENYGTSNIWLPITDDPESNTYRMNLYGGYVGSPVHPWINQPILSTKLWSFDTALFKSFSIRERVKLRVQADFFNTTNTPGNPFDAGSTDGLVSTYTGVNNPRTVQLSARFTF